MFGLVGSVVEGGDVAHSVLTGLLAQAAPAAASGAGMGGTVLFIGFMLLIFWLMMWRPQAKEQKRHMEMLASLKRGDEVVLQSAILGKVHEVTDKVIVLEVARDVRIRVLVNAISHKLPEGGLNGAQQSGEQNSQNK